MFVLFSFVFTSKLVILLVSANEMSVGMMGVISKEKLLLSLFSLYKEKGNLAWNIQNENNTKYGLSQSVEIKYHCK